jgi:cell division protein FtsB
MPASLPRTLPLTRRRKLWVAVAIGACLTGVLYYGPVKSYIATSRQLADRRAEVKALAKEKAELEQRLAISGTGPALLAEARRLGYVRPGEHLFIVRGVKEWLETHPNAPGRQK